MEIITIDLYCATKNVPIIMMYTGKRVEQLIIGKISIVTNRDFLLSMVLVAMIAGTLQPKPMIRGINDLPCNPILCMSLSIMNAARAI